MEIVPLFAVAFGIIGFAGGAVGYFAKGRGDSIIQYQSKQNELLKDDNARLEKSLAAEVARREALESENTRLVGLAQGSPQLIKLTNEIKALVGEYRKDREDRRRSKS